MLRFTPFRSFVPLQMSYFIIFENRLYIDNDFSSCLFILLMHRRSTKNSSSDLAIKLVLQEDEAKESIHCREGKDWGLGTSKQDVLTHFKGR